METKVEATELGPFSHLSGAELEARKAGGLSLKLRPHMLRSKADSRFRGNDEFYFIRIRKFISDQPLRSRSPVMGSPPHLDAVTVDHAYEE